MTKQQFRNRLKIIFLWLLAFSVFNLLRTFNNKIDPLHQLELQGIWFLFYFITILLLYIFPIPILKLINRKHNGKRTNN